MHPVEGGGGGGEHRETLPFVTTAASRITPRDGREFIIERQCRLCVCVCMYTVVLVTHR